MLPRREEPTGGSSPPLRGFESRLGYLENDSKGYKQLVAVYKLSKRRVAVAVLQARI